MGNCRGEMNMHRLDEDVVGLIKAAPAQIASFRQLISELGAEPDQRHEIRQVLQDLVKEGRIAQGAIKISAQNM